MTVRKRGAKYVLLSRTGQVLGTHESRKKAFKQEAAIEHSKTRKAKKS